MSHCAGNISKVEKHFEVLYCNHDLIVQHLGEALVFSGFPMQDTIDRETLKEKIKQKYVDLKLEDMRDRDFQRCFKLGSTQIGTGHDCFLKGVTVSAVFKAPQFFWQQIKRYHFFDIISSQSTMHRIVSMDIRENCNSEVDDEIIQILNKYITQFKTTEDKEKQDLYFSKIVNNLPSGFKLTAGITTNYLQLKTIVSQRKNHKLTEWCVEFIEFVHSLPYFKMITGCE